MSESNVVAVCFPKPDWNNVVVETYETIKNVAFQLKEPLKESQTETDEFVDAFVNHHLKIIDTLVQTYVKSETSKINNIAHLLPSLLSNKAVLDALTQDDLDKMTVQSQTFKHDIYLFESDLKNFKLFASQSRDLLSDKIDKIRHNFQVQMFDKLLDKLKSEFKKYAAQCDNLRLQIKVDEVDYLGQLRYFRKTNFGSEGDFQYNCYAVQAYNEDHRPSDYYYVSTNVHHVPDITRSYLVDSLNNALTKTEKKKVFSMFGIDIHRHVDVPLLVTDTRNLRQPTCKATVTITCNGATFDLKAPLRKAIFHQ